MSKTELEPEIESEDYSEGASDEERAYDDWINERLLKDESLR